MHDPLLPVGTETSHHAWLHHHCWNRWHEGRKELAIAALAKKGVSDCTHAVGTQRLPESIEF